MKKTSAAGGAAPIEASSRNVRAEQPQWLTLKDASAFLGVHFTTLRTWSDRGEVPVYRTPGGHRRFTLDDLRRFLAERTDQIPASDDHAALVEVAVGRVRQEIQQVGNHGPGSWRYSLDADGEQVRRQRGRQLFALALAYVLKPQQRERLLASGRDLGRQYGWEAAQSGVNLAETGARCSSSAASWWTSCVRMKFRWVRTATMRGLRACSISSWMRCCLRCWAATTGV